MSSGFSLAERQLYLRGPFPGRVDLWAEEVRYFQTIHKGIIGALLDQLQGPLFDLGYVAGRETSLQIAAGREPDLYIEQHMQPSPETPQWDYALAAEEILAPRGVLVEFEDELDALHIKDRVSGDLVTVIETVSPGNKNSDSDILAFQERRKNLYIRRGINFIEIDPTRSIKRLTRNAVTDAAPFHIAIYIPHDLVRIISIALNEPLSRFALPLRDQVIPVELQDAYVKAYQQPTIAWHIQHETGYAADSLPFPSLLTEDQKAEALEAVKTWHAALARARTDSTNE